MFSAIKFDYFPRKTLNMLKSRYYSYICLLVERGLPRGCRGWTFTIGLVITFGIIIGGLYTQIHSPGGAHSSSVQVSKRRITARATRYIYLAAYYRGGSTFLGELFNQNEDVFYWFEPLAGIQENLSNSNMHVNDDGSMKYINRSVLHQMTEAIEHIFTCGFNQVPEKIFTHRFMTRLGWDKSVKMHKYKLCLTSAKPATICRKALLELCQGSKYKVIKDIRLPLSDAASLLQKYPEMKIIYQTRDPRGQLRSLWPATRTKPNLPLDARYLCRHVLDDFKTFKVLIKKYPDRLLWLRYEDTVIHPEVTIRKVYDFVGASVPGNVTTWVWHNTHAQVDGDPSSTQRSNATKTANQWREKLKPESIGLINQQCHELIKTLESNI